MGSVPGWGIKIPHDAKLSQKINLKKKLVMSVPKWIVSATFPIVKTWKPLKCPSTVEGIN